MWVFDPDDDSDFYYHFDDCDDQNPEINPGKPEKLNGVDDNCDNYVDEGFNFTDRDNDGLNDWPEYHIYLTDYKDSDTDNDGFSDLVETNTGTFISAEDTGTDPNDRDTDGDGSFDKNEINKGTDPFDPDMDKDGLSAVSYTHLTLPTNREV